MSLRKQRFERMEKVSGPVDDLSRIAPAANRRSIFTERGGTQYDMRELVGNKAAQKSFLSNFGRGDRANARNALYRAEHDARKRSKF